MAFRTGRGAVALEVNAGNHGRRYQQGIEGRAKYQAGTCTADQSESVTPCGFVFSVVFEDHNENEAATYSFGIIRMKTIWR